jgi:hypothetical protein
MIGKIYMEFSIGSESERGSDNRTVVTDPRKPFLLWIIQPYRSGKEIVFIKKEGSKEGRFPSPGGGVYLLKKRYGYPVSVREFQDIYKGDPSLPPRGSFCREERDCDLGVLLRGDRSFKVPFSFQFGGGVPFYYDEKGFLFSGKKKFPFTPPGKEGGKVVGDLLGKGRSIQFQGKGRDPFRGAGEGIFCFGWEGREIPSFIGGREESKVNPYRSFVGG